MADVSAKVTDYATPTLNALYWSVALDRRRAFMTRVGGETVKVFREHFEQRDAEGNRRGWWRSHFWREMRDATALRLVTSTEAEVNIADPRFAAKRHGGDIQSKRPRGKLALPLNSEAKEAGKPSGGRIAGLFLVKGKMGKAWLATRDDKNLKFYYQLLRKVTLKPDPRALPEPFYVLFRMVNAGRRFVQRDLAKRRPPQTN